MVDVAPRCRPESHASSLQPPTSDDGGRHSPTQRHIPPKVKRHSGATMSSARSRQRNHIRHPSLGLLPDTSPFASCASSRSTSTTDLPDTSTTSAGTNVVFDLRHTPIHPTATANARGTPSSPLSFSSPHTSAKLVKGKNLGFVPLNLGFGGHGSGGENDAPGAGMGDRDKGKRPASMLPQARCRGHAKLSRSHLPCFGVWRVGCCYWCGASSCGGWD